MYLTAIIWIERFWRTLKQEYIYTNPADNGKILQKGLKKFINYSNKRSHQSLGHTAKRCRQGYELMIITKILKKIK